MAIQPSSRLSLLTPLWRRGQAERGRALHIGLLERGYNIVAAFPPEADLQEQIAQLQPVVIFVDVQSDAALKKVVAATAAAWRPIVCFTEDDKEKCILRLKQACSPM
jgi:response regulator NasT